jgi:hypothetical protein
MKNTRCGSSLVEFALLCPMVAFLCAGLFFVVQTGLRQIILTHEAARLARKFAQSSVDTAPRLASATTVRVETRDIPLEPFRKPPRAPRRMELVIVTLEQNISFFNWSARVSGRALEPRVAEVP